jgi:hypothetical protein
MIDLGCIDLRVTGELTGELGTKALQIDSFSSVLKPLDAVRRLAGSNPTPAAYSCRVAPVDAGSRRSRFRSTAVAELPLWSALVRLRGGTTGTRLARQAVSWTGEFEADRKRFRRSSCSRREGQVRA